MAGDSAHPAFQRARRNLSRFQRRVRRIDDAFVALGARVGVTDGDNHVRNGVRARVRARVRECKSPTVYRF